MEGHRPCAKKQQNLVPGARFAPFAHMNLGFRWLRDGAQGPALQRENIVVGFAEFHKRRRSDFVTRKQLKEHEVHVPRFRGVVRNRTNCPAKAQSGL
jgi:hypothetical protein